MLSAPHALLNFPLKLEIGIGNDATPNFNMFQMQA